MIQDIYDQLRRDERGGQPPNTYYTDTDGFPVIGYGHNLGHHHGISRRVAEMILQEDVQDCETLLHLAYPWTSALSAPRHGVLVNMLFNLGFKGLMGFHKMLTAVKAEQWDVAHNELLASTYAKQVPERAARLALQLLTDVWQ